MQQKNRKLTTVNYFNKIIFGAIIILPLIVVVCLPNFFAEENKIENIKQYHRELQRSFCGIVDNFYYDGSNNVKAFVIIFTNGYRYQNPFFFEKFKWRNRSRRFGL
jgi:hypothetical protein